jgi:hypothetical protein
MAIGTPAILKDNGAITTNGQTTVAVASVVIPAGSLVTVLVACSNATTAVADPTGVSDGTHAYTKDDTAVRESGNFVHESEWTFYDAAGGTRTITVTLGASCNYTHVVVIGTSNAATSSATDVIGGGDQGGTTTVAVISVGNVAQNDEASVEGLNWGSSTALTKWPPTNYTSLFNTTNATRTRGHAGAYRTPLTSVGAQETGSNEVILAGAASWAGTLVTYKGATAGGVSGVGAIPSGAAFGTTQILRQVREDGTGIASSAAVGQPSVPRQLGATGIVTGAGFGVAQVQRQIGPTGIGSSAAVGQPTLNRIFASGISTGAALGQPAVRRQVGPAGISTGAAFGQPKLSVQLVPVGIVTSFAAGVSTVQRQVREDGTGIASAAAVGQPRVGAALTVYPQGIASGEQVGAPRIIRVTGIGIPTGEVFGRPALASPAPIVVPGGGGPKGLNFVPRRPVVLDTPPPVPITVGGGGIEPLAAVGVPTLTLGPPPVQEPRVDFEQLIGYAHDLRRDAVRRREEEDLMLLDLFWSG